MEINILDPGIVNFIVQEIESEENLERKRNEWVAYQCETGNTKEYVKGRLKLLFPKNSIKMRVSDISISKKVIDKVSCAYAEKPMRTSSDASDTSLETLNDLYKNSKMNQAMQEFDEVYNLHRHGLLWVDYDMAKLQYKTMALRPFEYDVIRDPNSCEVLCVILNYPDQNITMRNILGSFMGLSTSDGTNQLIQESQFDSGTESKVYAMWTPTQHAVIVVQKKKLATGHGTDVNFAVTFVPIDGNPSNVNPLGMIPFVFKQKSNAADYPVFNPLTEQSINFNILNSDLLTASSMQGFGQALLSYPDGMDVKEIEIGYMSAIKLPQSTNPGDPKTEYTFANANPALDAQQKINLTYLKQVLAEHGINSQQAIDGDVEAFASGLDRMIANADVNKIVQKNQECYTDVEREAFKIFQAWDAIVGKGQLKSIEDISVYYPKPTVQISEGDVINNAIALINAGLSTKQKALMKLNPNLTEKQADEELAKINKERSEQMAAMGVVPTDLTQDGTTPEPAPQSTKGAGGAGSLKAEGGDGGVGSGSTYSN